MMKTTTKRARDGKYTFDGDFSRLCRCGHSLGVHLAESPHECDNLNYGDGAECGCQKFRPVRAA